MSSLASEAPRDGGSRLLWALRHYWVALATLACLVVIVTGVAALRVAQATPVYDATASVIAAELAHDPASLARLAEAVAADDEVLEDAVRRGDLPYTETELYEEHLEIVPLEDNILVQVIGKATDEATAVRTANAVAEALAESLDEGGPGVGSFRVLNPAETAELEDRGPTALLYLVMGLVAALAGVLGLAGLLLAVRVPITGVRSAAALTGLDVLTVVSRDDLVRGRATRAHAALAHVLGERNVDRVTITAPAGGDRERTMVARGLVRALGHTGAALVPAVVEPQGTDVGPDEVDVPQLPRERVSRHNGAVVVDGVADEGGTSSIVLPRQTSAVVVIAEGQSETAVQTVISRLQRPEILGLVFVSNRNKRRSAGQSGATLQSLKRPEVA